MRQGEGRVDRDEALRDALEQWEVDDLPAGAQERLLARYRREYVPWWRRFAVAPVRIALPVAVSLLLVAGAALMSWRSGGNRAAVDAPAGSVPAPSTVAATSEPAPRSSLAGFQPLDEVTATVVTESP